MVDVCYTKFLFSFVPALGVHTFLLGHTLTTRQALSISRW